MIKKHRIFIGLREVAGYFGNLKAGFDMLGEDAVFMNLGGNRFGYPEGKNPGWVRFFNWIGHNFGKHFSRNFFLRFIWLAIFQNLFSFFAFHIAVCKCNTFILGSNSTFFFFLELPLLRLLNKKIIYVFLGSDSRPVYLNGYVMRGGKGALRAIWLCRLQKLIIRIIERFADHIVNHPPQSHFHKRPYTSFLCLGIPFDGNRLPRYNESESSEQIRILHAPSKAAPKGSDYFRRLVAQLKEKGLAFEYTEISGLANAEVLQHLITCDFIIDERYSDTPMAVFAAEAAFAGKPALVGGYYSGFITGDIPEAYIPPGVFCHPDHIPQTLEKLILDESYRKEAAQAARDFVHTHWDCRSVAEKYLLLINGAAPAEWMYDPATLRYPYGCGLSADQAAQNISAVIKKEGKHALGLRHNPSLEAEVIHLAEKHAE